MKPNFKLFKFKYSSPMTPNTNSEVIIITTNWPEAFSLMFQTYGENVTIYGVENWGNVGQTCIIDPKYCLDL